MIKKHGDTDILLLSWIYLRVLGWSEGRYAAGTRMEAADQGTAGEGGFLWEPGAMVSCDRALHQTIDLNRKQK